jgi:hypothetical protein
MTEPTLTCPTVPGDATAAARCDRNQVDNPENRNVRLSDFLDNAHLARLHA